MFRIPRVVRRMRSEVGAPGQPPGLTRPPIQGRLAAPRVTAPQVLSPHRPRLHESPRPLGARPLPGSPDRSHLVVPPLLVGRSLPAAVPGLGARRDPDPAGLLAGVYGHRGDSRARFGIRPSTTPYYLATATAAIALTLAGRAMSNLVIRQARRRQLVRHRSIIVGSGPVVERITDSLASAPDYGLSVVGYLADQPDPRATAAAGTYLGRIRCLRSSIDQVGAAVVLVSDRGFAEEELAAIVRQALWNDCSIFMVPRLHELNHPTWKSEMIGSIPVIRFGHSGRGGVPWKCKRAFDIVASTLALLLLAPVLVMCAIAVRIDGGPGILFRQTRVGRDGRPFELIKFRSLRAASEQESETTWSIQQRRTRESPRTVPTTHIPGRTAAALEHPPG